MTPLYSSIYTTEDVIKQQTTGNLYHLNVPAMADRVY